MFLRLSGFTTLRGVILIKKQELDRHNLMKTSPKRMKRFDNNTQEDNSPYVNKTNDNNSPIQIFRQKFEYIF